MKTLTHRTKILMLLGILFFMNAHSLKSQSPSCEYSIENNLECTITIQIDYFDDCITPAICNSQTFTLSASSVTVSFCHGCNHLCNIKATLLTAGGVSNGSSVDINNMTVPLTLTSSCGNGTYSLDWSPNGVAVH